VSSSSSSDDSYPGKDEDERGAPIAMRRPQKEINSITFDAQEQSAKKKKKKRSKPVPEEEFNYDVLKVSEEFRDKHIIKPLTTNTRNTRTWKPAMKGLVNEIPDRPKSKGKTGFKTYIKALTDFSNPQKLLVSETMHYDD